MVQQDKIDSENMNLFLRIRKQKTTLDNTLSETSTTALKNHIRIKSGGSKLEISKKRNADSAQEDRSRLRTTSFDGGFESTEDILDGIKRFRKGITGQKSSTSYGNFRRNTCSSAAEAPLQQTAKAGFFQPLKKRPGVAVSRPAGGGKAQQGFSELIYVGNFESLSEQSICFEVRVDRSKSSHDSSNQHSKIR